MNVDLLRTTLVYQVLYGIPVPQLVSGLLVGLAIVIAGVLLKYPGPITPEYADRVWGDAEDETPPTPGQNAPA